MSVREFYTALITNAIYEGLTSDWVMVTIGESKAHVQDSQEYKQALAWIMDNKRTDVGSFLCACDHMGFQPDLARRFARMIDNKRKELRQDLDLMRKYLRRNHKGYFSYSFQNVSAKKLLEPYFPKMIYEDRVSHKAKDTGAAAEMGMFAENFAGFAG